MIKSWTAKASPVLQRFYSAQTNAAFTATTRAETTLKRFWKNVKVEKRSDSYAILLDHRPLKTPSGNPLHLPHKKGLAAGLIASEWDAQKTVMKPHALPMTSLASRAIDLNKDEQAREEIHSSVLNYLDTDAICFHHDYPPQLTELQVQHWKPILDWIRSSEEVEIITSNSILIPAQPLETRQKLGLLLRSLNHWQLAAIERATLSTKSLLIAFALVKQRLNAEEASQAATVEVDSQTQRWGQVEDSHDVDYQDIRRQLGCVSTLLCDI